MKNKSKFLLLILVLLMGVLVTSALAQEDEDMGETAVTLPDSDFIETVAVEELPSGVTQVTAYIYANKATFISSGNPTTNYGSWADMYFGYQPGAYGAMRPFIYFPVDQLPSGATISSATFNIYLISVEDTQNRQYNAYTVSSNWDENNLVWDNQPGRSSTVAFNANLNDTIGWHSTSVTSLVQNWYSSPGNNHGVEIVGEEQGSNNIRRYSSNGHSNAPYLTVQYTTNTKPPTAEITNISPYVNNNGTNWTSADFNISWTATDYSGTGIRWYDMYYTPNNGSSWIIGQAQVTHTTTPFGPLTNGVRYGFYVRARDNSGLEGAAPSGSGSVQMSVTIDGQPPAGVTIEPLPEYTYAPQATLEWSAGNDIESGIQNYDVQGRVAGGIWADLTTTTATSYNVYNGTNGVTYEFRVRGRDRVGNVPDWSTVPTTSTTVSLEPIAYISGFNSPDINAFGIYSKNPVGPQNTDNFTVLWTGLTAPNTSIVSFDLQYQKPGNSTWFAWQSGVQTTSAVFQMTDNTTDFPDGIYTFQVKARNSAGQEGQYRTETQGTIVVDREGPWMTDNQLYLPVMFK